MLYFLYTLAIYLVPVAILVWFIVSLVRFLKTPKDNAELRKKRRLPLILSSISLGIILLLILGLIILTILVVSFM